MAVDLSSYLNTLDFDQGEAWNLPIAHWSPSSLEMLQRCPRQWQQRYIHGRKERPGEALLIGTTVHDSIERNFAQKIASGVDLPIIDLLDYFAEDGFPRILKREQEATGEEVRWDTDPAQARKRGGVMLVEYQDKVAPRVQPLNVELVVNVDFGLPVPVTGRFDVDRNTSVIDVKTGRQKQTKPRPGWKLQAAVYGAAAQKPVEFHSVTATTKTNTVNIVTPLESEEMLIHPSRSERDEAARSIRALSDYACFLMARYGKDEEWPTFGTSHQWACSFCGYIKDCPAWSNV